MAWSRKKVDSATINSGNEYAKGDRVSRQNLNAMVNGGALCTGLCGETCNRHRCE